MQQFHKFITWHLCVAQHVSGVSPSLWFYRWREAVGALLVVVWQTMTNNAPAGTLQR